MMRVRIAADNCTLGKPGDVVTVPDGVNGRGLVKAGTVVVVPEPKKKPAKKKGGN